MSGRTGEPENIEEQLAAFAPRVYGLLVRLVGRPEVAEDLMQETLLRALRSLETYRPEGKLRAWVFRIAVNLARDWIRRRPREAASSLDDGPDCTSLPVLARDVPPGANLDREERRRQVEAAVARLPDPDREVLLMRYYGDMPFKDIAQATGEPLGTVLARAHRSLKKLGDLLPEEEDV